MKLLNSKEGKAVSELLNRIFYSKKLHMTIIAIAFFGIIFAIVSASIAPEKYNLKEGDRSPVEIIAPKDVVNKIATDRLKGEAVSSVQPRYKPDYSVFREAENKIKNFFSTLEMVRQDNEASIEQRVLLLETSSPISLDKESLLRLLVMEDDEVKTLESNVYYIINTVMSAKGLLQEDVDREKNNIEAYFSNVKDLSEDGKKIGTAIAIKIVKPNLIYDQEITEGKIEEVLAKIEPVVIKKYSTIVNKGDEITGEHIYLLRNLGLLEAEVKVDFILYTGIALVIILCQLIVTGYIIILDKTLKDKPYLLILASIIIILTLMIGKVLSGLNSYLIPVAAASMLISILIDPRFAIITNIILSLLTSIIVGNDISILIISMISGTIAALCAINSSQRSSLFVSGLLVGVFNGLIIIGLGFMNSNQVSKVLLDSSYGILNGIVTSVIVVGSLPLWESTFRVLTPLKLLELSNPNQPLLKKLLVEAPGTYHHSIIVGNLSEAAADRIGANGLLARVGSYYHDIGKLKRPYFFKENQLTSENPHDKITPSLSTLIITSHVKDGVEMAKKFKVPTEIRNFIQQHHGESLVKFFYHKALNGENNENIREESFRYEGPNPTTKEVAIVMLADATEAAVRSMSEPTRGKMENLIRKIVKERLEDGQLDNCDLTLKELDNIVETFVNVLLGIFHERIEYPEIDSKNLKGGLLKNESTIG